MLTAAACREDAAAGPSQQGARHHGVKWSGTRTGRRGFRQPHGTSSRRAEEQPASREPWPVQAGAMSAAVTQEAGQPQVTVAGSAKAAGGTRSTGSTASMASPRSRGEHRGRPEHREHREHAQGPGHAADRPGSREPGRGGEDSGRQADDRPHKRSRFDETEPGGGAARAAPAQAQLPSSRPAPSLRRR